MDQIKIGNFLAELRKKEGLTQEALGEALGVTNKTVSRWETGTYMPDMEMFLLLSELYHVNVNELLSGEYLSDADFREKSEENVGAIVKRQKHVLRRLVRIAVVSFICLLLSFLSVFAVLFLTERSRTLHPISAENEAFSRKIIGQTVTVPDGEPGEVLYKNEESGIAVRFSLPGYHVSPDHPNVYLKDEPGFFVTVRVYYSSEYPCPTTLGLGRYFADANICRFTDKVRFAVQYPLDAVNVFSSESDIEIAAGCRMLLEYGLLPNRAADVRGEYHTVTGKWRGIMTSIGPAELSDNVWQVVLEDDYRLMFLTIKDPELGASAETLAAWLSTVSFADGE